MAIRQLLADGWPLESILLSEARFRAGSDIVSAAGATGTPVFRAAQELFDGIAGFHVHRGALALAVRPPERAVAEVVAAARTVLVVEGVNDHENLGALFRNGAAFGVDAVVLDPTTADPLYRRAVRVSVGHVLRVPYARARSWPDDLGAVRAEGLAVAALTPAGATTVAELAAAGRIGRWAVMVGAEGAGLSARALAAADVSVRVPMSGGVDSVNVATAAAIVLQRLAEARAG
jgi:tRNA G18 (ribose-2'-O)-methylase SpoU